MIDIYVFHRNNVEMTERAVACARSAGLRPIILDNSDNFDFKFKALSTHLSPHLYTFASMHNFLAKHTGSYFWMHNDVEAPRETFDALIEACMVKEPDTGIVLANYDCISWVNAKAIEDAGWWDLALPQYFSDVDIYRRVQLAGYKVVELALPLTHHKSGSLQEPMQNLKSKMTYYLYEEYYKRKWGGTPLQETYTKPFEPYLL